MELRLVERQGECFVYAERRESCGVTTIGPRSAIGPATGRAHLAYHIDSARNPIDWHLRLDDGRRIPLHIVDSLTVFIGDPS